MLSPDFFFESSGVSDITRTKGLLRERDLTAWWCVNCGHGRHRVLSRDGPKGVVGASRAVAGQLAGASVLGWWRWRMRRSPKRRVEGLHLHIPPLGTAVAIRRFVVIEPWVVRPHLV